MIICLQVNIFFLELSNHRYTTRKGSLYDHDNHLIKTTMKTIQKKESGSDRQADRQADRQPFGRNSGCKMMCF